MPLISLEARRLVADKTVLIAEAAHVLSPIGAQGLNLSLRDVDILADTIVNALKAGQALGSKAVLQSYERKRLRDIQSRHYGVDILNRIVANNNPLLRRVRRIGLKALGFGGPVRHILMQEGLAPKA